MTNGTPRFLLGAALFLVGVAWMQPAGAQNEASTGAITGVVVEEGRGEPMPGANVRLKGTSTGTSTDLNGRYRIDNLEAGTYDLVFSFVGFQQKTLTGVEVESGGSTTVDVTLAEESAQLDEVVV